MNKPNVPEAVIPGNQGYSFRTDMQVNAWMSVALLTSFAGEELLLPHHNDWPVALRAVIALAPLLAGLLWVWSAARWICGMDELHRRITLAACLFASVGTFFVVTAWQILDKVGVTQLHLGFYFRMGWGDDCAGRFLLLSRPRHFQPPLPMKNRRTFNAHALHSFA